MPQERPKKNGKKTKNNNNNKKQKPKFLSWQTSVYFISFLKDQGFGFTVCFIHCCSCHFNSFLSTFFFLFFRGTGSLFQKDTSIFSIKTVTLLVFLSPNRPPKRPQKRVHFKPIKLQDAHLTDLTETSPNVGGGGQNCVGKETLNDQWVRIWHCRELWCRSQTQLRSHIAVAVV